MHKFKRRVSKIFSKKSTSKNAVKRDRRFCESSTSIPSKLSSESDSFGAMTCDDLSYKISDLQVDENSVPVDPLTDNPDEYWDVHCAKNPACYRQLSQTALIASEEKSKDVIRVVCISDTHNSLGKMKDSVPNGDILIHCGDFTFRGAPGEVKDFAGNFRKFPHKYKICIAGNHELSFDTSIMKARRNPYFGTTLQQELQKYNIAHPRELLNNIIYLEDSAIEIMGYKFYGTPWQPDYGAWAFNLARGKALMAKWNRIPTDTDILITHTPPVGHGDYAISGTHAGDVDLLNSIQSRIHPLYHIFGHIHEGYGITTNGQTTFVNASTCDRKYAPINAPIVFDLPIRNADPIL